MLRSPAPVSAQRRSLTLAVVFLAGLSALFLFPYLFQGKSMLPLELMGLFQPWAEHRRELWGSVPPVHNALVDSLQQYYPRRVYFTDAVKGGWLPFWNPGVYGGSPFHASQQGAVLYPPAWVLALLPPALQFGWSAFFHLSLAGVGTFLFLRRMGLAPAAAAAGGVAFAFNGFAVVWLAYPNVAQWTLAWLPLALYCWERGRSDGDLRWTAASGIALALSLLGGHAQSSAYTLLVWGAWALFRSLVPPRPAPTTEGRGAAARTSRREKPQVPAPAVRRPAGAALLRLARGVVFPAALAITLSLGHLLPALEFTPRTDRSGRVPWGQAVRAGMPAAQLWTLFLPRLFGDETSTFGTAPHWMPLGNRERLSFVERSFYPGASVLVLAFGAAGLWARRTGAREETDQDRELRRLGWFASGVTLAGFLLAMATPLYWPLWRFAPGFGQFTAVARILCISAWGFACLAALGVHALTAGGAEVRGLALRAVAGAAVAAAAIGRVGHFIYGGAAPAEVIQALAARGVSLDAIATRDLLLALVWIAGAAVLAFLAARGVLKPGAAGVIGALLIAADLFSFGFGFNPRTDPKLLSGYTSELGFLRYQTEQARADGQPFRFLSVGPPGREMDFRQRMPSNLPSTLGLADMLGSDSFVTRRYRDWENAMAQANGGSPWSQPGSVNLRAAGVRYYLTGTPGAFPRLGLAPVLTTPAPHTLLEDPEALPYARLHTNVQALSRAELLQNLALPNRAPVVALTSGPDAPVYNGTPTLTPFRVTRPNGNRLVLEGEAPEPGLLFVSEQYDPGWRARVDGRPARVVPVDHLFVGVPVPQGRHRVELVYAPSSYRVGAFLSLCAVAVACGLVLGRRRVGGRSGGEAPGVAGH